MCSRVYEYIRIDMLYWLVDISVIWRQTSSEHLMTRSGRTFVKERQSRRCSPMPHSQSVWIDSGSNNNILNCTRSLDTFLARQEDRLETTRRYLACNLAQTMENMEGAFCESIRMLSVIVWPNERSEEPFKNKRAARHNQQGQPVSSSCALRFLNSK